MYRVVTEAQDRSPASNAGLCVGDRLMTSVDGRDITNLEENEAADLFRQNNESMTIELTRPDGLRFADNSKTGEIPGNQQKTETDERTEDSQNTNIGRSRSPKHLRRTSPNSARKSELLDNYDALVENDENSDIENENQREGAVGTSRKLSFSRTRKINKGVSAIIEQENSGYSSSDTESPVEELHPKKYMCKTCIKMKRKRLPEEKLSWPINNVNYLALTEIEERLDLSGGNNDEVRALACNLGFSNEEIRAIYNEFSNNGHLGAAKEFIEKWGKKDEDNGVRKLREKCKELERNDICRLIDEWVERNDDCRACGALLN